MGITELAERILDTGQAIGAEGVVPELGSPELRVLTEAMAILAQRELDQSVRVEESDKFSPDSLPDQNNTGS